MRGSDTNITYDETSYPVEVTLTEADGTITAEADPEAGEYEES